MVRGGGWVGPRSRVGGSGVGRFGVGGRGPEALALVVGRALREAERAGGPGSRVGWLGSMAFHP